MKLPPGPTEGAPLQLVRWLRDPFPFLEACRARYGETFTLRIPGAPPFVVVTNPEHIREVFASAGDDLHAGKVAGPLGPFLGARSVLLLDGPEHLKMRKLLMPPFHGERMQAYGRDMIEATHASVDRWPLGRAFPVHQPMQRITLEVILRTVFGLAAGAAEGAVVEDAVASATWPPLLIPAMQQIGRAHV